MLLLHCYSSLAIIREKNCLSWAVVNSWLCGCIRSIPVESCETLCRETRATTVGVQKLFSDIFVRRYALYVTSLIIGQRAFLLSAELSERFRCDGWRESAGWWQFLTVQAVHSYSWRGCLSSSQLPAPPYNDDATTMQQNVIGHPSSPSADLTNAPVSCAKIMLRKYTGVSRCVQVTEIPCCLPVRYVRVYVRERVTRASLPTRPNLFARIQSRLVPTSTLSLTEPCLWQWPPPSFISSRQAVRRPTYTQHLWH